MWVEREATVKEIHDVMKQQELPENIPSYDSWKRHIQNHLKARFAAQADDDARTFTRKKIRESASVLDEITINLRTCRNLADSTTTLLQGMLKRMTDNADLGELRQMTALNNSVTKQIGELRRTLEFVHKLKRELKVEPDTTQADAIKFAEVMDEVIPNDILITLRQRLKEVGLSEF